MVGDTVHDMHMARAAGVKAIGVAWVYHRSDDLKAAGADVVIRDFSELDAGVDELIGAAHA
jgi:phosphoglycolate phosphatase